MRLLQLLMSDKPFQIEIVKAETLTYSSPPKNHFPLSILSLHIDLHFSMAVQPLSIWMCGDLYCHFQCDAVVAVLFLAVGMHVESQSRVRAFQSTIQLQPEWARQVLVFLLVDDLVELVSLDGPLDLLVGLDYS